MGDMLLKRYVVDFVGQMQQLSTPLGLFKDAVWRCPKCFGHGSVDAIANAVWDEAAESEDCKECQGYKLLAMPYELFWTDEELTELFQGEPNGTGNKY